MTGVRVFRLLRRTANKTTHFPSFFSTDTIVMASSKATVIKKLHKANKEMFGELLESKSEKMKKAKALTKQKKAEAKKKAKAALLSGHNSELNLDDSLDPDVILPEKTDTKPEFIHATTTNFVLDHDVISIASQREDHKAEINWTMKNFPQRAKLISRFQPGVLLESFQRTRQNSEELNTVPETSAKATAVNQVPSLQQLFASLEFRDIRPRSEKAVVTKSNYPDGMVETSDDAEISLEKSEEKENQVNVTLPECPERALPGNDSALETMAWPSISYDNPARKPASVGGNPPPQLEILSYQYDYKSKPSLRLPSVSKILQATMSPEQVQILQKWEQKIIAQLGEDGFKKYKAALFANGKELHKNLQLVLSGTPREYLTIDDAIFGHWNSLQALLPEVRDVHVLESLVAHPQLGYCGIVDCVAVYRDKLVLIDWKTSEKKKSFVSMTYDTPLQISAYIGALNHDPNYQFKVTSGLIVIAYQDGSSCQHFQLNSADLTRYWNEWLRRLNLYKNISEGSTTLTTDQANN